MSIYHIAPWDLNLKSQFLIGKVELGTFMANNGKPYNVEPTSLNSL